MTRDEDRELDALLDPLRRAKPDAKTVARWQEAVAAEAAAPHAGLYWLRRPAQIAAALAIGYALGFASSHELHRSTERTSESVGPVATIQYVFDKTE